MYPKGTTFRVELFDTTTEPIMFCACRDISAFELCELINKFDCALYYVISLPSGQTFHYDI